MLNINKTILPKILFLLLFTLSLPQTSSAQTPISGSISTPTVWTKENNPYIINGFVSVQDTLTIKEGVEVQFANTSSGLGITGSLIVEGTQEEKVLFTSLSDTPTTSGAWQTIHFGENSTGNIKHAEIKYGGYIVFPSPHESSLINYKANLTLDNVKVIGSRYYGLSQEEGNTQITNSTFSNQPYGIFITKGTISIEDSIFENNQNGLYIGGKLDSLTLKNNSFISNSNYQVYLHADNPNFIHEGNSMQGNSLNGYVLSNALTENITLEDEGLPYITTNYFNINQGATLTLEEGVEIAFRFSNGYINVYGTLITNGKEENNVLFTTNNEKIKGMWGSIYFHPGGTGIFNHTTIEYGGAYDFPNPSRSLIYNDGGSITILNSTLKDSSGSAIENDSGNIEIEYSKIYQNNTYGIRNISGIVSVLSSDIYNNLTGISNADTVNQVNAINNFWGDATGPYHPTLNSLGLGNRVSDGVLFVPWLNMPFDADQNPPITIPKINEEEPYGETAWYSTDVNLSFEATDDFSGINFTEYSTDNGITWIEYNSPILVSNGLHNFMYRSVDNLGHIEEIHSLIVQVDLVYPETTYTINGTIGDNDWYTTNVFVELSLAEDLSGIYSTEYSLNQGEDWNLYESQIELSDGLNNFYYLSIDNAGNAEDTKNVEIKIDTQSPATSYAIEGQEGLNGWLISSSLFTLSALDEISQVKEILYSLDGGSNWLLYTEPISLSEGIYNIDYKSKDFAGNTEEVKSVTISIDGMPLTSVLIDGQKGNEDWYVSSVNLSFDAVSSISGISSTEYSIDNGSTWNTYTNPVLLDNGIYTVLYKSTNNSGNVEEVKNTEINIDIVSPDTTASFSSQDINGWYKSDVYLTLNSNDALSGVNKIEYSIDEGTTWNTYTESVLFNSGVSIVLFRAVDNAGNIEDVKTVSIKVDNEAPEAIIKFDENTQSLLVLGVDNLGKVSVVNTDNSSLLTDEAGNTLLVKYSKLITTDKRIRVQVNELVYNGVSGGVLANRTILRYHLNTFNQTGNIRHLVQMAITGNEKALGLYHFLFDATKIIKKVKKSDLGQYDDTESFEERDESHDNKSKTVRENYSGLKVLGLQTQNGLVKLSY